MTSKGKVAKAQWVESVVECVKGSRVRSKEADPKEPLRRTYPKEQRSPTDVSSKIGLTDGPTPTIK